jgi:Xaa-Pro aminopeptidase
VAEVLAAKKIDSRGLQGDIHHFIGMSTHEGALLGGPLQPGMVLTVEPGLYLPERRMGVRIEDTILITAAGCEILTAAAPKEINEIEALMKKGKPGEK